MARKRTGSPHFRHGRWYAQVFVRKGLRPTLHMATITAERDAKKAAVRAAQLAELAACLAHVDDEARALLERAAGASDKTVKDLVKAGREGRLVPNASREGMTFGELAKKWTTGELARSYPDHVRTKTDTVNDVSRFDNYILPHVKDVRIVDFTLDHADAVMRALPAEHTRSTRRQTAVLISRVMALAVVPLRLIPASPIPRGWLPRPNDAKPKAWLYPAEEAALLACTTIPIERRMGYGFLAREGCRKSEPSNARVDLTMGVVTLDKNKTKRPRAWKLGDDVTEALKRYAESHAALDAAANLRGDQLREDLAAAGVKRAELFERTPERDPVDIHNLRDTFVTLALAAGRTESWIRARTGHTSSAMLTKYEGTKQLAEELALGWLAPMHEAIPELAAKCSRSAAEPGSGGDSETENQRDSESTPGRTRTFNPRIRRGETVGEGQETGATVPYSATYGHGSPESAALNPGSAALRDPVEEALATALERASAAGEWGVVQTLAAELEARRKARMSVGNVVPIDKARRGK